MLNLREKISCQNILDFRIVNKKRLGIHEDKRHYTCVWGEKPYFKQLYESNVKYLGKNVLILSSYQVSKQITYNEELTLILTNQ